MIPELALILPLHDLLGLDQWMLVSLILLIVKKERKEWEEGTY